MMHYYHCIVLSDFCIWKGCPDLGDGSLLHDVWHVWHI